MQFLLVQFLLEQVTVPIRCYSFRNTANSCHQVKATMSQGPRISLKIKTIVVYRFLQCVKQKATCNIIQS